MGWARARVSLPQDEAAWVHPQRHAARPASLLGSPGRGQSLGGQGLQSFPACPLSSAGTPEGPLWVSSRGPRLHSSQPKALSVLALPLWLGLVTVEPALWGGVTAPTLVAAEARPGAP